MSNYQSPHVYAKASKKKSNYNNLSSFLIAHFLAPRLLGHVYNAPALRVDFKVTYLPSQLQ